MATIDLHDRPFTPGTLTKLEIFEKYTQAWIPVFAITKGQNVFIVDFFAGTGYDLNGVPGSPIRILSKILEFSELLLKNKTKVHLHLNEFKKGKCKLLIQACTEFIEKHLILSTVLSIEYTSLDFKDSFKKEYPHIRNLPALVFLDQNGVKFLNSTYINALEATKITDFLYFVSTSFLKRFSETPEFKKLGFDLEIILKNPYPFIHQSLLDIIRSWLPSSTKLKLYPFSIKKPSGIYGLVFGASHPAAVVKFLKIAWEQNAMNGSANFDIDEDLKKGQMSFFEPIKLNKIEHFQEELRMEVLSGNILSNYSAFFYALDRGHIPAHAKEVLESMKKAKLIDYSGTSPLISYEKVCKEKISQEYVLLKPIK
jgi:three-Cys-motif partner protein